MAKKKNTFGKFIAFTAAAATIGGTCYVFRDKIKQSSIYKAAIDKASNVFSNLSKKDSEQEDDDFFFDDDLDDDNFDEVFSSDTQKGREYTSITINPKEEEDNKRSEEAPLSANTDETSKPTAEETIPTISFGTTENDKSADAASDNITEEAEVDGYENENLSDVSEDPDVLEDQDKLDF